MKLTIARFTLELMSPMHIGSGLTHPTTDAPVVRDAFGDYRIPGSSLAGALRAATCGAAQDAAWGAAGAENLASMIEVSGAGELGTSIQPWQGFSVGSDVKELLALANKSKGSLWAGMSLASAFGAIVSWVVSHWGGR